MSAQGSNARGRRRGRRRHGQMILRGRYDGGFDRTNLPDDVILTNSFTVRDGRIGYSLEMCFKPWLYDGSDPGSSRAQRQTN